MSEARELIAKRITVPKDLYKKAMKSIENAKFPGIRSFSGVCEHALAELFKEAKTHG